MRSPRISVIMGVLNAEDRVVEAVESIQNQTFKDWEFIIFDDGSTDQTYSVLLEISKNDPRIKVKKNKGNIGLTRTLNHCLEISKGEYVARMDDDDYSYSNRLQIQIDYLDNHRKYDFISSSVDIYDGNNILYTDIKKETPQKKDFLWNSPFVHPATMFRKSKLLEVGGYRFSKETRRAEDYDLFMRMYAKGMRGYNHTQPLLRYFENPLAMKKRKYKYRIDEVVVRYKGFRSLGLYPIGFIYVVKPLIVGLIPNELLVRIKKSFKLRK